MKNKVTLFLVLTSLLCTDLSGQIDFLENIIIDESNMADRASSVYAADMDGDGDLDMLSTSSGDGKIAWYENTNGLGAFGLQNTIGIGVEGAFSVYAVDLDNDGDSDIVAAGSRIDEDMVIWNENIDGLGTFDNQQVIASNAEVENTRSIYPADINGDGYIDVLVAFGSEVVWYENLNGTGGFGEQQSITQDANGANAVFAIDIDNDGDLDVLSSSAMLGFDKIAWYENLDGQGAFGVQQIISTDENFSRDVYGGDVDGDGDMDVITAAYWGGKVSWYENLDGQGSYGPRQIITELAVNVVSIYANDVDNDGDLDILSALYDDDKITWYENLDGTGSFGTQQILTTEVNDPISVYTADLDGDGDQDVLSASQQDDKIAWYENIDGTGIFGAQQILTYGVHLPSSIYAADLDGDGDQDILSSSVFDNKIAWYENLDGQGTIGRQQIVTTDAFCARSVWADDLDGDGDIDILSASRDNENKIAWYENVDGEGNFGPQQIISTDIQFVYMVRSGDLDGDGDVDVLSASYSDDKIAWYENLNGQGDFGEQQIISVDADGAVSVYVADLDNDGDLDVLSTSAIDDKVAWYENLDGDGSFSSEQIITTSATEAWSVHATDLDGDGDMDVLFTAYRDDKVAWYENTDGLGTFANETVITTDAMWVPSAYATDLDGDGDMDVLSASQQDDKIAYYENVDGLGNFGEQQVITTDARVPISVYATDLNGDGNLDVLSASDFGNKIVWYENNGPLSTVENGLLNFIIFPVPTSHDLNVITENNIASIEIYNTSGQLLLANKWKTSINISALPDGFYICKIKDDEGAIGIKKIIKE